MVDYAKEEARQEGIRAPGAPRLISSDDLDILLTAAVESALVAPDRADMLLAGMPAGVVYDLPTDRRPRLQLSLRLATLNGMIAVPGLEEPPLLLWMANTEAALVAAGDPFALAVREVLERARVEFARIERVAAALIVDLDADALPHLHAAAMLLQATRARRVLPRARIHQALRHDILDRYSEIDDRRLRRVERLVILLVLGVSGLLGLQVIRLVEDVMNLQPGRGQARRRSLWRTGPLALGGALLGTLAVGAILGTWGDGPIDHDPPAWARAAADEIERVTSKSETLAAGAEQRADEQIGDMTSVSVAGTDQTHPERDADDTLERLEALSADVEKTRAARDQARERAERLDRGLAVFETTRASATQRQKRAILDYQMATKARRAADGALDSAEGERDALQGELHDHEAALDDAKGAHESAVLDRRRAETDQARIDRKAGTAGRMDARVKKARGVEAAALTTYLKLKRQGERLARQRSALDRSIVENNRARSGAAQRMKGALTELNAARAELTRASHELVGARHALATAWQVARESAEAHADATARKASLAREHAELTRRASEVERGAAPAPRPQPLEQPVHEPRLRTDDRALLHSSLRSPGP